MRKYLDPVEGLKFNRLTVLSQYRDYEKNEHIATVYVIVEMKSL